MAHFKLCSHCGERKSCALNDNAKYLCRNCNTAEKRAEMDKNNKELFESKGLEFHCFYCERRKTTKEE